MNNTIYEESEVTLDCKPISVVASVNEDGTINMIVMCEANNETKDIVTIKYKRLNVTKITSTQSSTTKLDCSLNLEPDENREMFEVSFPDPEARDKLIKIN